MQHSFRHLLIDDFLSEDIRAGLLEYTLENERKFLPTGALSQSTTEKYHPDLRVSLRLPAGLGRFKLPLHRAITARLDEIFDGLGMRKFDVSGLELELAAHRDGAFFRTHIDTMTQNLREGRPTERMISLVYYFHNQPRHFTGGELALYPLGKGEPSLIEPRDNRLLAFPSFAIHEVKQVQCDPDDFRNARFAVNCWLHRTRAVEAPAMAGKVVS